jgi:protein SCO1/2
VTLDPARDTPAVLRSYAARYAADLRRWTFATGDDDAIRRLAGAFGVFYQADGAYITHNLSTALVGPDGRLRALWRGNEWTIDEVLAAVAAALSDPPLAAATP